jgi:hypothetical protein
MSDYERGLREGRQQAVGYAIWIGVILLFVGAVGFGSVAAANVLKAAIIIFTIILAGFFVWWLVLLPIADAWKEGLAHEIKFTCMLGGALLLIAWLIAALDLIELNGERRDAAVAPAPEAKDASQLEWTAPRAKDAPQLDWAAPRAEDAPQLDWATRPGDGR